MFSRIIFLTALILNTSLLKAQEKDYTQQGEYKENMDLFWSINTYRSKYKLTRLNYRFESQPECDKRIAEIQKNFSIPEEGYEGICDGEVIFKDSTYIRLLGQMIERTELYYDKDVGSICISMRKKENWYYVVVRMWRKK